MGGTTIEVEGIRASNDPFFMVRSQWEDDPENPGKKKKVRIELPVEDVSEKDVRRSALGNFIVRLTHFLLGLRNLSWEELEAAGIPVDEITSITFKSSDEKKGEKARTRGEKEARRGTSTALDPEKFLNAEHGLTTDDPGNLFRLWIFNPPLDLVGHLTVLETWEHGQWAGRKFWKCPHGCETQPSKQKQKRYNFWGWKKQEQGETDGSS